MALQISGTFSVVTSDSKWYRINQPVFSKETIAT